MKITIVRCLNGWRVIKQLTNDPGSCGDEYIATDADLPAVVAQVAGISPPAPEPPPSADAVGTAQLPLDVEQLAAVERAWAIYKPGAHSWGFWVEDGRSLHNQADALRFEAAIRCAWDAAVRATVDA